MENSLSILKNILGDGRLDDITKQDDTDLSSSTLTNSKDIFCECKTLVLRSNHAKLIIPTESMLEVEKDLGKPRHGDKMFKNLVQGCYWLVDDMYKFEQMGYTREINSKHLLKSSQQNDSIKAPEQNSTSVQQEQSSDAQEQPKNSSTDGIRYLACADCNLCPLGWYDPTTKESYLYVW